MRRLLVEYENPLPCVIRCQTRLQHVRPKAVNFCFYWLQLCEHQLVATHPGCSAINIEEVMALSPTTPSLNIRSPHLVASLAQRRNQCRYHPLACPHGLASGLFPRAHSLRSHYSSRVRNNWSARRWESSLHAREGLQSCLE